MSPSNIIEEFVTNFALKLDKSSDTICMQFINIPFILVTKEVLNFDKSSDLNCVQL